MQSQRTTPATVSSPPQTNSEELAAMESRIEARYKAFTHEVDQMREEWNQVVQKQSDETRVWLQKLEKVEQQMRGLSSFATHVEKFLAAKYPVAGGATAPADKGQERRSPREGRSVTTEHPSGASSSSTRPPDYIHMPTPPGIPAPPPPNEAPQPTTSPASSAHFRTLRSEVRAGAIGVDISKPEQWSPRDTAILKNQEAKQVRDIGSLIFETPIQTDYEAGVEVRSLLPTEQLEQMESGVSSFGLMRLLAYHMTRQPGR